MAKSLFIVRDHNGAEFPAAKLGDTVQVAAAASSAQSAAIDAELIRVHADVDCHIAQGLNPTATTAMTPLSAGAAEYFRHAAGEKVAVIKAAGESDGTLSITEMR